MKSLSEIDTTSKRASKAVGFSWGEAEEIGKRIAEKAIKAGIKVVAFDRSGFKYHGRIKALADAARDNGLTF